MNNVYGLLATLLFGATTSVMANITGLSYQYKDWELVCENTGICRAAAYQREDAAAVISVLLTRHAGKNAQLEAQVQIQLGDRIIPHLNLNLPNLADNTVRLSNDTQIGQLSAKQTQALLTAVQGKQPIRWTFGDLHWHLSVDGATATLVKMDEFQHRLNTPTALMKKGQGSSDSVLIAQQKPQIRWVKPVRGSIQDIKMNTPQAQKLKTLLLKKTEAEACELLKSNQDEDAAFRVYPLNAQHKLLEVPCWRAAYNMASGFAVLNNDLTKIQQWVTSNGSDYELGKISAAHKGRGLGDCWTQTEWVWNGKQFFQSYHAVQLQCRGFAGGAWDLPLYQADVLSP